MIHFEKFQRCRGIRIDLPKNRQLEFWWCPFRELVPSHTHPTIDSHVSSIFGFFRLWVKKESWFVIPFFVKRIPPDAPHSFKVLSWPFGIFVNFAKCLKERTSAATDFVLEKN